MNQNAFTTADSGSRAVSPRYANSERPLTEIVDDLWSNTEQLVRQELELVVAQLERKSERLKADVRATAIGGAVLYAGALAMIAAAILLLSKVMDPWLASLLVGAAASLGGFVLVQKAKNEAGGLAREQVHATAREISYTAKEIVK